MFLYLQIIIKSLKYLYKNVLLYRYVRGDILKEKYYIETKVICFLKQDIARKDANCIIGNSINQSMFLDENLKKLHKKSGFKFYSFDSFYPLSDKNGIYNKGSIYMFRLRSLNNNFANSIANILKKISKRIF